MAYENLKAAIKQAIKQNGNQEITGPILQSTLLNIVDILGADYKFLGLASPSTVPPTSEERKLFYFASKAGKYVNFPTSPETYITIGEGLYIFTKENNYWGAHVLIDIAQKFGDSTDKVISQKAVSDKINNLSILSDNGNWQLIRPGQNLVGHLYEYGYVSQTGTIVWEIENTTNHVISSLISVKAGITYELNSTATDAARPGVFLDYKGNVISVIDKGTTSIIAPNNAEYLIACTSLLSKDIFYVRPTEGYTLDERSTHYIPLLKIVENNTAKLKNIGVKSEMGLSNIDLSTDDTEQYIDLNGNLMQGGRLHISKNEIILNPECTIYLYARGYKSNVSMISKEKGIDDKHYQPLSVSIDSELHLYEFTNYENTPINIVLCFNKIEETIACISTNEYNNIGNLSFANTRNTLFRPNPVVSKLTTQMARGIKYLEVYYEPIADETKELILANAGYYKANGYVYFQFKKDENELHTASSFCIDLMYKVDTPPTGTQLIILNKPEAGCFLKAIVDFDIIKEYSTIILNLKAFPYEDISKNNPDYISRIINVETADYVYTQTDGAYITAYGIVYNGGKAMYSKPFLLKSKETISVYAKSYKENVGIINEVLKEDKSYKVLVPGVDSTPHRYIYTNNTGHDIYIAISSLRSVDTKVIAILNKNEVIDEKLNKSVELDFNFMQSLKPLEQVLDTPRFAGLIHQWAFIGDSLNSGEVYINNSTGQKVIDAYEWSWGQAICRLCGTQGTNFSRGGLMASTWWNAYVDKADKEVGYHTGGTNEKFTDRKFNAYTICLGTNECNQSYNIGSVADVDLSNYNNNKESFYGYYCKIIQYIREINPSAKIFLITIPILYHSKGESYGVNTAIRTIANMFDNCFLVDLYKYIPENSELESKYRFWGHLTAAGYQWMGYVMANLFSYIIENNLASFKNVPFIGTQYDDGNLV